MFWHELENFTKEEYAVECYFINTHVILTNIFSTVPIVETIILEAKYYLYKCFLKKVLPDINKFKNMLRQIEEIEKDIAEQKNVVWKHNIKWRK